MLKRPLIMVSNDDGHQSEGLAALVGALEDLAEVWVVAPESEQSATSHSISLTRPLRLRDDTQVGQVLGLQDQQSRCDEPCQGGGRRGSPNHQHDLLLAIHEVGQAAGPEVRAIDLDEDCED